MYAVKHECRDHLQIVQIPLLTDDRELCNQLGTSFFNASADQIVNIVICELHN